MNIIDTFLRWRTGRGFGVQSPSAYNFIRYVLKEEYPYYCYDSLKEQFPLLLSSEREQLELFFRLANFWQPDVIYCNELDTALSSYLKCGCQKTSFADLSDFGADCSCKSIVLLRCRDDLHSVISSYMNKECMVVLTGIKNSQAWKSVIVNEKVIRSYDVGDIGILFFDNTKLKEHFSL